MKKVTQQPLVKNLQVRLTKDAHRRIKIAAAANETPPGRLLSDLVEKHLPAVPAAEPPTH